MRLDMGYFPRKNKVDKDDIIIREEICYTKAHLQNGNMKKEILTFGPLCVLPEGKVVELVSVA